MRTPCLRLLPSVLLALTLSGQALGQTAIDPGDPARAGIREQNKRRAALEKEFKKLRFTHFGDKGNPAVRKAGIDQLRTYTDALGFQAMVEVFGREKDDVRTALLDHFVSLQTSAAQGAIAWAAVTGVDPSFRAMAVARLAAASDSIQGAPDSVRAVVQAGLTSGNEQTMRNAADVAGVLGIFEVIPILIQAQQGTSGGGGGEPQGDQAYIFVGRQQSFVSDLTPVVSESAVAFDPTVSVLSTGSLLRVSGAVVTTERIEIHSALVGLSSRLGGADTSGLGYNIDAWKQWQQDVFVPKMRELAIARAGN